MDLAYDNIVRESLPADAKPAGQDGDSSASQPNAQQPESTLNQDIQEAWGALSSSSWGSWLGGQVGGLVKQGGEVYREAHQEVSSLGVDAGRGLASLRARAISMTSTLPNAAAAAGEQITQASSSAAAAASAAASAAAASASSGAGKEKDKESDRDLNTDDSTTPTATDGEGGKNRSDEALKTAETYLARLKLEAAKRLKDIQRAEDAADEALLNFGKNVRDFLQDAIVFKPGSEDAEGGAAGSGHRFESKDESGKRVIHTSRYDAQLHVIHTTEKSFTEDPSGSAEFAAWASRDFDVEARTEAISADLAKYPELRATMEKLVPDKVPYADFWKRYYFLRHSIDTAEARRKDLLKAASAEEDVGWGDEESSEEESDSSDESDDEPGPSKPSAQPSKPAAKAAVQPARPESTASSTTIQPPAGDKTRLKPAEPRKSDEKSQADSDTSYDVVGAASGKTSQAPNSPKDARKVDNDDEEEEDSDEEEDDEDDDDSDEEWE